MTRSVATKPLTALTLGLFTALSPQAQAQAQVQTLTQAQDSYSCAGAQWTLEITGEDTQFVFPAPTEMQVMLTTRAEGQDWPRALTLVGDRDTAIVILEQLACPNPDTATPAPLTARILTQRGQTPILLTGCCDITPPVAQ